MKVYLKDGNLYWLEEPLDDAEMSWDLSETQQEFLRGGGITINCPIKVKVSPEDTKIISEKPCNPRVNVLDSTLIKVMVEED